MNEMHLNYLAVFGAGVAQFLLGGLWYSPALFAKKWMALIGKTQEELRQGSHPFIYVVALVTALITSFILAHIIKLADCTTIWHGAVVGFMCWLGFAGATSFTNQVNFLRKSFQLWAIDSGYNLVSFMIAGAILAVWR